MNFPWRFATKSHNHFDFLHLTSNGIRTDWREEHISAFFVNMRYVSKYYYGVISSLLIRWNLHLISIFRNLPYNFCFASLYRNLFAQVILQKILLKTSYRFCWLILNDLPSIKVLIQLLKLTFKVRGEGFNSKEGVICNRKILNINWSYIF